MAGPRTAPLRRGPQANPKAAIQDWLTLVDPDGAFLTTTELTAVFPHGFEPMPADQRTELRAQVADLNDGGTDRVVLRTWLLDTALDWGDQLVDGQAIPASASVRSPEHGVQLRPDLALLDVDQANKTRHTPRSANRRHRVGGHVAGQPDPTGRDMVPRKWNIAGPGHRRRPVVPSLGPPGRPGRFMSVARR